MFFFHDFSLLLTFQWGYPFLEDAIPIKTKLEHTAHCIPECLTTCLPIFWQSLPTISTNRTQLASAIQSGICLQHLQLVLSLHFYLCFPKFWLVYNESFHHDEFMSYFYISKLACIALYFPNLYLEQIINNWKTFFLSVLQSFKNTRTIWIPSV